MLLTYHHHDKSPTPGLDELIEKQKTNGGRLIQYRRAWAAIAVISTQDRVEWLAPGGNRYFGGWRHSLFTCILGLWSILSIFAVPMILFSNFSGGIDVTEFYSESATDLFRSTAPVKETAQREAKNAEWAMLAFLTAALIIVLLLVLR